MQYGAGQQSDLRPWQHISIFVFACAILISRRPDAIFHAQFWAEDGHVWFADAYNLGWWAPLFRTQDGYFQTLPRLGASLTLLVPLSLAPLVLNLIATAAQALPVNLLLSSRSSMWGSLRYRAVLAAMYLALPNCKDIIAIITNSQWILALCVFLGLVASTPNTHVARLFDLSILTLCGLTGPFCIFLLPIAFFLAWKRRGHWRLTVAGILAALCLVQAWGLLVINPSGRSHHAALGASPALLARILAGNVYLGTLLGGNVPAVSSSPRLTVFLLLVAIGGTAIVAACLVKAGIEMKLLLLLSSLLVAASLISPVAYSASGTSRWEVLAGAFGIRYWFFPTLAFAWSLLWCIRSRIAVLRIVAAVLCCIMCVGIVRDWRIPPLNDLHFAEYAQRFEAAPPGTAVTIPINPPGWEMRLVKHP
jgi:hypothetical protein